MILHTLPNRKACFQFQFQFQCQFPDKVFKNTNDRSPKWQLIKMENSSLALNQIDLSAANDAVIINMSNKLIDTSPSAFDHSDFVEAQSHIKQEEDLSLEGNNLFPAICFTLQLKSICFKLRKG